MIHFSIIKDQVFIHAVIHTKLNPSKNWIKK